MALISVLELRATLDSDRIALEIDAYGNKNVARSF
jgi:hypothetical protein